ncbi:VWA domain-containing protein [Streptomyces violens]|uniref:VWA domain-containing protein n=1 Tax=Streptomyces violens TaxID=66377 RepID=UPI0004BF87B1|nr:VWA domain-containing protein [Streptomyces violens]
MPLYDARGKQNRALIIGVSRYQDPRLHDLDAVFANPDELGRVLCAPATDLFLPREVTPLRPDTPEELTNALRTAASEARGLLLVYFSGHGRVRRDGSDLHLLVGSSQVARDERGKASHEAVSWANDVLPRLERSRADRVVVVLECCFAGNADDSFRTREKPVSLLMAAQPNRRIFSGKEPGGGTTFTRAVLDILEHGIEGKECVTFEDLAGELRRRLAGHTTPQGGAWVPRASKQNTVDDVVVSFATREPRRPRTPFAVRARRWWRSRPRRRLRLLTAAAVAPALTATALVLVDRLGPPESCPPAQELRLLTAPEAEPTLRAAALAYEMSALNTEPVPGEDDVPDGCRRTQITVYSAAKDQVAQGFAAADRWQGEAEGADEAPPGDSGGQAVEPLYRPGPQPDLWVPESTVDYLQVRRGMAAHAPATLHRVGPVAFTPLVVGVPAARGLPDVEQAGSGWHTILDASADGKLRLLRPSPALSGIGLMHTIGLYLADDGAPVGQDSGAPPPEVAERAERRLRAPGSQYAGSAELLCSLRPGAAPSGAGSRATAAPLVTEKSLADANLGHAVGNCPALATVPEKDDRYEAYYPSGVPGLDHPLIRVAWQGAADAARRQAASERFADWLRRPDGGQRVITEAGYRGVNAAGRAAPPPTGSPLRDSRAGVLPDVGVEPYTAGQQRVAQVLAAYDTAHRPGQLLFLLDTSTSMADGGRIAGAADAVGRALEVLGPKDTYGLWTYPRTGTAARDRERPVERIRAGSSGPAAGRRLLEGLRRDDGGLVDQGAWMQEALTAALDRLRDSPAERTKAVVLVLDEDDGAGKRSAAAREALSDALAARPRIPVVVLATGRGGCDAAPVRHVVEGSGGNCVAGGPGAADTLAGLVASFGTGGQEAGR